jgi:hypothetical protein
MGRLRALDAKTITGAITETSPGNYVLGYLDGSAFTVFRVGRSDSDVGASLRGWVDAPSRPRRERTSSLEPWRRRSAPLPAFGMRASGRAALGADTAYTHFAFCYAPSALAAFEQECRDFHEFGGREGLDNDRHPRPPADSPWACPLHR